MFTDRRSVPQEFVKDGLQFVNRCTKPDKVRPFRPDSCVTDD